MLNPGFIGSVDNVTRNHQIPIYEIRPVRVVGENATDLGRRQEHDVYLLIAKKNTQAKFDDLTAKLMEARVAHGLEREQKGERFTILEAPRLPEKPYKPNRMAIILIGFVDLCVLFFSEKHLNNRSTILSIKT